MISIVSFDDSPMSEETNIRDELLRRFKASGLSIKAVADRSCLAYYGVHGALTGKRTPRVDNFERICRAMGFRVVLVPEDDCRERPERRKKVSRG